MGNHTFINNEINSNSEEEEEEDSQSFQMNSRDS